MSSRDEQELSNSLKMRAHTTQLPVRSIPIMKQVLPSGKNPNGRLWPSLTSIQSPLVRLIRAQDLMAIPSCSVRRNICYGLEEEDGLASEDQPSQEQIEEAAKLANAHDFISALPRGYDMVHLNFCSSWIYALHRRQHILENNRKYCLAVLKGRATYA